MGLSPIMTVRRYSMLPTVTRSWASGYQSLESRLFLDFGLSAVIRELLYTRVYALKPFAFPSSGVLGRASNDAKTSALAQSPPCHIGRVCSLRQLGSPDWLSARVIVARTPYIEGLSALEPRVIDHFVVRFGEPTNFQLSISW